MLKLVMYASPRQLSPFQESSTSIDVDVEPSLKAHDSWTKIQSANYWITDEVNGKKGELRVTLINRRWPCKSVSGLVRARKKPG